MASSSSNGHATGTPARHRGGLGSLGGHIGHRRPQLVSHAVNAEGSVLHCRKIDTTDARSPGRTPRRRVQRFDRVTYNELGGATLRDGSRTSRMPVHRRTGRAPSSAKEVRPLENQAVVLALRQIRGAGRARSVHSMQERPPGRRRGAQPRLTAEPAVAPLYLGLGPFELLGGLGARTPTPIPRGGGFSWDTNVGPDS